MSGTVRIYDPGNDRFEELPPGPLHIHVHGPGLRAFVMADLLRRVVTRRRRVRVTRSGPLPPGRPLADYNVLGMDEGEPASAHVLVAETEIPAALASTARPLLVLPSGAPPPDADPVALRLAILSAPYRASIPPVDPLAPDVLADAHGRLVRWRGLMAEWASFPGRPLDRSHAEEAEAALANDLDGPAALAVVERLAADPAVAPGAKLETLIHLDLLLALDLVSDIGRS